MYQNVDLANNIPVRDLCVCARSNHGVVPGHRSQDEGVSKPYDQGRNPIAMVALRSACRAFAFIYIRWLIVISYALKSRTLADLASGWPASLSG